MLARQHEGSIVNQTTADIRKTDATRRVLGSVQAWTVALSARREDDLI